MHQGRALILYSREPRTRVFEIDSVDFSGTNSAAKELVSETNKALNGASLELVLASSFGGN
jgi:hypothetical protein